jgi:hypothetical protein
MGENSQEDQSKSIADDIEGTTDQLAAAFLLRCEGSLPSSSAEAVIAVRLVLDRDGCMFAFKGESCCPEGDMGEVVDRVFDMWESSCPAWDGLLEDVSDGTRDRVFAMLKVFVDDAVVELWEAARRESEL